MTPYRSGEPITSLGEPLLVPGDAPLPAVCLKCATPYSLIARPARLRTRPAYTLPLCRRCDERRENARKGLVFAAVIAGIGVLGTPFNARSASDAIGVPAVSIIGFALVFFLAIRPRMLRARETAQGHILLRDVHPAAAELVRRTVRVA
jgi:hypothetical protein